MYINTGFTARKSTFVDPESSNENEIIFESQKISPKIAGTIVPMVKGEVTLRASEPYDACGTDCPINVGTSIGLKFSILKGSDLATARTELLRLVDVATTEYALLAGIVPPPSAILDNE